MARVLRVYAALYRVPGELHIVLRKPQLFARRNAYLRLYKVYPGDELRYRVLHLDTGVHLHEVEIPVLVHQELYGARVLIAADLSRRHRRRAHSLAELRGHDGAGAFLQHLLVVPLEGALALAQVHHVAVVVREELYLHMAWVNYELLNVYVPVAEARESLLLSRKVLLLQVLLALRKADTAAAAAGSRLYHDRVAYFSGDPARLLNGGDYPVGAGHHRHSRRYHGLLCGCLVAHGVHYLRGGAYERYAAGPAQPREIRVLGQESEAGVYRLGMSYLARGDYRLGVQVAVLGSRRAYAHGFVRYLRMERGAVSLGVHRHRLYSKLAAGAHYAYGYLAPVCNKYLVKHSVSSRFIQTLWGRGLPLRRISQR